jgi:hypothetical protein
VRIEAWFHTSNFSMSCVLLIGPFGTGSEEAYMSTQVGTSGSATASRHSLTVRDWRRPKYKDTAISPASPIDAKTMYVTK